MTSAEMRIQKAKELEELKEYVKANCSAAAYKYNFRPSYIDLENPLGDEWLIDEANDMGERGWEEVDEVEAMKFRIIREWNKRIEKAEGQEWEEVKKELGNWWFNGGEQNETEESN